MSEFKKGDKVIIRDCVNGLHNGVEGVVQKVTSIGRYEVRFGEAVGNVCFARLVEAIPEEIKVGDRVVVTKCLYDNQPHLNTVGVVEKIDNTSEPWHIALFGVRFANGTYCDAVSVRKHEVSEEEVAAPATLQEPKVGDYARVVRCGFGATFDRHVGVEGYITEIDHKGGPGIYRVGEADSQNGCWADYIEVIPPPKTHKCEVCKDCNFAISDKFGWLEKERTLLQAKVDMLTVKCQSLQFEYDKLKAASAISQTWETKFKVLEFERDKYRDAYNNNATEYEKLKQRQTNEIAALKEKNSTLEAKFSKVAALLEDIPPSPKANPVYGDPLKVGDKVRVLQCRYGFHSHKGQIGIVENLNGRDYTIAVALGDNEKCEATLVQKVDD